MSPILVTGFGPFEYFNSNPSESLAKGAGMDHAVLEVSYKGVDRYLENLKPNFNAIVMLGLHGTATRLQLEVLAHNWIGTSKDVLGEAPVGLIGAGPSVRAGT